jgi:hypothetical protein
MYGAKTGALHRAPGPPTRPGIGVTRLSMRAASKSSCARGPHALSL